MCEEHPQVECRFCGSTEIRCMITCPDSALDDVPVCAPCIYRVRITLQKVEEILKYSDSDFPTIHADRN